LADAWVEKEARKELMFGFQNLVIAVGVCRKQPGGNEMRNGIIARLDGA
jgi:hypothetical protein